MKRPRKFPLDGQGSTAVYESTKESDEEEFDIDDNDEEDLTLNNATPEDQKLVLMFPHLEWMKKEKKLLERKKEKGITYS
ncbi:hypothetical protein J6590_034332 [Homalodisca vitripennis]|nr:hypothetical protein J6590_034332 [Homalodisca vitripennis]